MNTLAHVPVPVLETPVAGRPVRLMGYACLHCGAGCPSDTICHGRVREVTRHVLRRVIQPARRVAHRMWRTLESA